MEDSKVKDCVESNNDANEHKLSIGDAVNEKGNSDVSPAENNYEELQENLLSDEVSSIVEDKELNSSLLEHNYTADNLCDEHVEESNVEQKNFLCEKDEQVKDNDDKLWNKEEASDTSHVSRNEDAIEFKNDDIPEKTPLKAESDATKKEVIEEKEEVKEGKPSEQWYADEGEESDDSRYSDEEDYTDDGEQNSQEGLQANRRRRKREENDQLSEEDQDNEYEEELSGDENQGATDEEHVEGKRFSGDGQEEPKVDKNADEDRKNPAYVPRKGAYFEHDLRALAEDETVDQEAMEKVKNKKKSRADDSKWKHDKFDASEQAPKKTHEIVRRYGYDIRRSGYSREGGDDEARQNGENKKNRTMSEVPSRYNRRPVHRPRADADNYRSDSPSNLPQKQINLRRNEEPRDFQSNKNRPREAKKNHHQVRGYRTEIITTRGGRSEDKDVPFEREPETQNRPDRSTEEMKAKSRGRDNRGNQRPEIDSRSNEEFCDIRTRKFVPSHKPPREEVDFEPDRERDSATRYYERKGYSYQRSQYRPVRQPREPLGQRPPRMVKQYADKPPRELEIVNSNVRGRIQNKISEDEETKSSKRAVEDKRVNDKSNDSLSGSKDDDSSAAITLTSSTVSAKSSNQSSDVLEARKGWAGGEFTPSWRTDPQQRRSSGQEEETNVSKGSKRYSSSRQQLQQQKHQQFRDMDYYQQYPQYGANGSGTAGQVYDTMIPHPAYVPHSALVTNSYAPFYSTLPGNVYPSPPVYQHPQLAPYTNTSYVHHVTQAAEGPVFFSPQGLAQGQFYEAPQSAVPHMRATSAIPIVNPQDLAAVQNRGTQPETVAIHSQ